MTKLDRDANGPVWQRVETGSGQNGSGRVTHLHLPINTSLSIYETIDELDILQNNISIIIMRLFF